MNRSSMVILGGFLVLVLFLGAVLISPLKEAFCGSTGLDYEAGCDTLPVPKNIQTISRSPPFYDLNAVRPSLCSYKNYQFPPPLDYPAFPQSSDPDPVFQYWDDAMLSHPQTPYVI